MQVTSRVCHIALSFSALQQRDSVQAAVGAYDDNGAAALRQCRELLHKPPQDARAGRSEGRPARRCGIHAIARKVPEGMANTGFVPHIVLSSNGESTLRLREYANDAGGLLNLAVKCLDKLVA